MVLSLPFVLALIGSAVGLIIGMVIYGDISEAIECPASGGGGGGGTTFSAYNNLGTIGSAGNALYYEYELPSNFVSIPGRINEAVIQNGTSSLQTNGEIYLGLSNSTWNFLHRLGDGSDTVSINLWINGDVDGAPDYPILTNYKNFDVPLNERTGVHLATQGASVYFIVKEDGISVCCSTSFTGIPPDDSQWHMMTFTYDKSIPSSTPNLDYYLDGVFIGTANTVFPTAWTGGGGSAGDKLTIGSDADHDNGGGVTENTFKVDDVAIWNGYTLTGTDVTNLWNSGSGMAAGSISPSNLKGYWNFDTSSATTTGGGGGGSPEVGSEQCQQAKDISWTVIGIIPVALFFSLFAIFSALGTGRQG